MIQALGSPSLVLQSTSRTELSIRSDYHCKYSLWFAEVPRLFVADGFDWIEARCNAGRVIAENDPDAK